jgi:hypothetical protein
MNVVSHAVQFSIAIGKCILSDKGPLIRDLGPTVFLGTEAIQFIRTSDLQTTSFTSCHKFQLSPIWTLNRPSRTYILFFSRTTSTMPPLSSAFDDSLFVLSSHSSSSSHEYTENAKAPRHDSFLSMRPRSVGFDSSRNQVVSYDCDHADQDNEMLWFSKKELQEIKAHCSETVARVMAGQRLDQDKLCERGLENMFRAASLQTKSRRRHCFKVVLEEQALQEQQNNESSLLDKEQSIAQLYTNASARSVLVAASRGILDSKSI